MTTAPVSESTHVTSARGSAPAPRAAGPSAAPLQQVDQALARDLDNLLQGDFESIEAVLNNPDPQPRVESAINDQQSPVSNPQGAERRVLHADGSLGLSDLLPDSSRVQLPTATAPAASVDCVQTAAPAGQASAPHVGIQAQTAIDRAPLPAAAPIPEESLKHGMAQPLSQATIKLQSTSAPSAPIEAVSKPRRNFSFVTPLVKALAAINFPLRYVPAGFRPALNVGAISLLVWVPIVWVVAYLSSRGPSAAHADQTTAAPAVHKEPTHVTSQSPADHQPAAH
jgi:hypothetical protein